MPHTLSQTSHITCTEGDPLQCFHAWAEAESSASRMLLVDFELSNYWLKFAPATRLTVIYLLTETRLQLSVTDRVLEGPVSEPETLYSKWVDQHDLLSHCPGEPLELASLAIPKPWGQEIWYSGVEERGVCQFRKEDRVCPIPWLQAVIPDAALGDPGHALVLLKILDPVAEPVTGDLYFELHEEKQEVYVVTHVDESAWPDGTGYIRIGFAADKLAPFAGSPDGFRTAYLGAVVEYERIRRAIDALPEGETPTAEQSAEEARLRQEMDSYSHLRPLRTGDVVKVPLLTPHSLQHGVRTVEFQTPVYERKILSFAQRVLTQDHWDTEAAVAQMQLDTEPDPAFELLQSGKGLSVERIVDFSDFEVRRVRLEHGAALELEPLARYALVMVIEGTIACDGADFEPESALILPRNWRGRLTPSEAASALVFLLALPRN